MDKNTVGYIEPKKDLIPKESHKLNIYDGCEEDYKLDENDFETLKYLYNEI